MNTLKSFCKLNLFLIFFLTLASILKAEVINKINIEGNNRISSETIEMFSGVSISDNVTEVDLNNILKRLYNTNFFDLVSVKVSNETLIIKVKENPIIQNISYEGVKSSKIFEDLKKSSILKSRSSLIKCY